jgi:Tfp pilus assembly protein PilX
MGQSKHNSRGFTLIAALLITVLLSAVAAGLLFMVSNEVRMGGNGLEDNLAYYGAESGMEKLSSDLASLYQTSMAPTNGQIQNLVNFPPTSSMVGSMNYIETITYPTDANGNPVTGVSTISAGVNQGMYAQTVPMTLQVIASRPTAASVNITRQVEVALIPVFQFGVFCGYDCSYFAGPNFSFGGRVHTNGNLFLASGANLVFNDKIAAFGQIILDRLENNHLTSAGYGGTVYGSTTNSGCPLNTFPPPTGGTLPCLALTQSSPNDASWSGGIPLVGSANGTFPSISSGTFNGYLANSLTGATNMQLPFVQKPCTNNPPPCTDPIQLIRKVPGTQESAASTIGQSRLYNKAQIRILLADTQLDLHPERPALNDGQDIQFNLAPGYVTLPNPSGNEYFGVGASGLNGWIAPLKGSGANTGFTSWPLLGETTTNPTSPTGAWLRVEYLNQANPAIWVGVTTEWLRYGFGRTFNVVPTGPYGSANQNSVNPQAILILQQLRNGLAASSAIGSGSQNNWFPINFYDPREGEMRDDNTQSNSTCSVQGIMNAVELDTGNLALWLRGASPYTSGSGLSVNYTNQNGYLLYFSDRRGMLPDPNAPAPYTNTTYGEAGLEDVVNAAQPLTSNTPDGVLEAATYYSYSPEDVDLNAQKDFWGQKNLGYGFGTDTSSSSPYSRVNCLVSQGSGSAQANAVTGARHVLKLVDGSLGNLPVRPDNRLGGFTVASENPVYIQGDYNTNAADTFWSSQTNVAHSAAAVMADAVSVLSNNWSDVNSLSNPINLGNRPATPSYYRLAVAGGKNIPFPQPTWSGAGQDFGTDGGLHNFLRLLENWGGQQLNYDGSLVSMYYAEYNTGTFKCCAVVYGAPRRNFWFDTLFLNPANLPPGTPMFQDVVSLGYHANFTPQ